MPEEGQKGAKNFLSKHIAIIGMLKKENRLVKAKDIKNTFARGRSFFSPLFSIKYSISDKDSKFTVVVSTKVFKNAVDRNRLKRIIREFVRKNLTKFKKANYIIVAKPKINSVSESEILKNFAELCSKLR